MTTRTRPICTVTIYTDRRGRTCRTEVHQQNFGNCNYVYVDVIDGEVRERKSDVVFTVYIKDASCGRGEYAEELDVAVTGRRYRDKAAIARTIAEHVLRTASEFEPGMRVVKVVERFGMFC